MKKLQYASILLIVALIFSVVPGAALAEEASHLQPTANWIVRAYTTGSGPYTVMLEVLQTDGTIVSAATIRGFAGGGACTTNPCDLTSALGYTAATKADISLAFDETSNTAYIFLYNGSTLQLAQITGIKTLTIEYASQTTGLTAPAGVVIDSAGNMFVTEYSANRVAKITPANVKTYISPVYSPVGIAIDSTDNLYVAEYNYARVAKITPAGVISYIANYGTGNGAVWGPWDVTVDSSDNVYVTETYNKRVQKLSNTGAFIKSWTGFNYPTGVAVDSTGNIYVSENALNKLIRIDGTTDARTDLAAGQVIGPMGLSVDSGGTLFVAETTGDQIATVPQPGTVTHYGSAGSGDGQFNNPYDAYLHNGSLYIADNANNRVVKLD